MVRVFHLPRTIIHQAFSFVAARTTAREATLASAGLAQKLNHQFATVTPRAGPEYRNEQVAGAITAKVPELHPAAPEGRKG